VEASASRQVRENGEDGSSVPFKEGVGMRQVSKDLARMRAWVPGIPRGPARVVAAEFDYSWLISKEASDGLLAESP
jgi:hypothetical protein